MTTEGEHMVMVPAAASGDVITTIDDGTGPDGTTNDNNNTGGQAVAIGKGKTKRKSPTKRKTTSKNDGESSESSKGPSYRKMTDPERYHVFAAAMQAKALHGSVGARDQQYSKEMYNTTVEILESTVDLHGLKGSLMPGYTTIRGLLTKFYNTGYVSREVGGGGCLRWGCRLSGKGTGGKCLCHQKVREER